MTGSAAQHLPVAVLRPVRGHHAFEACVEQLGTAIRLGVCPMGSTRKAMENHCDDTAALLRDLLG